MLTLNQQSNGDVTEKLCRSIVVEFMQYDFLFINVPRGFITNLNPSFGFQQHPLGLTNDNAWKTVSYPDYKMRLSCICMAVKQ